MQLLLMLFAIWFSNYANKQGNRVIEKGATFVTPTAANEAAYKKHLAQAHI
jgi:hypothetical protein